LAQSIAMSSLMVVHKDGTNELVNNHQTISGDCIGQHWPALVQVQPSRPGQRVEIIDEFIMQTATTAQFHDEADGWRDDTRAFDFNDIRIYHMSST
jgi:hypothetical protein